MDILGWSCLFHDEETSDSADWTFPYIMKKMWTNAVPTFYVEFDTTDWDHLEAEYFDIIIYRFA